MMATSARVSPSSGAKASDASAVAAYQEGAWGRFMRASPSAGPPCDPGCRSWLARRIARRASDVQEQELPFPRADHLHERLVFGPLDRAIGRDEALAEDFLQFLLLLEQRDRLEQAARQVDLVGIGRAGDRVADLQPFHQAQIAA